MSDLRKLIHMLTPKRVGEEVEMISGGSRYPSFSANRRSTMMYQASLNRGVPQSATRVESPLGGETSQILHDGSSDIPIQRLRSFLTAQMKLAKQHCAFQNAGFMGDCLLSLCIVPRSPDRFQKLYQLAQSLFLAKEYLRVAQIITYYDCEYYNLRFTVLLANAYFHSGLYKECLACLLREEPHLDIPPQKRPTSLPIKEPSDLAYDTTPGADSSVRRRGEPASFRVDDQNSDPSYLVSMKHLILGKAFQKLENKEVASEHYQTALRQNPLNYEAFDILLNHKLLQPSQMLKFLASLEARFTLESLFIYDLYKIKILALLNQDLEAESKGFTYFEQPAQTDDQKPDQEKPQIQKDSIMNLLHSAGAQEVQTITALRLYNCYAYDNVYSLLKEMVERDPFHPSAVPLYAAVLLEKDRKYDLYFLSHKLITTIPDSPLAWYVVAVYYYSIGKYEISRNFFMKAFKNDRLFVHAYIGYAHSFATMDESEQAMSAYRSAARLFPGCHQANMYIGMEYLRTNNLHTALLSFKEAAGQHSRDPAVHQEIGVALYRKHQYLEAKKAFERAFSLCVELYSQGLHGIEETGFFQTLLINMGHCMRKLKQYGKAIKCYEKALNLNAHNPSTLSSLGFTHHLCGNLAQALQLYHEASFSKSDDHFVHELIHRAVHDSQLLNPDAIYGKQNRSGYGETEQIEEEQEDLQGKGLARSIYEKPSPFNYH